MASLTETLETLIKEKKYEEAYVEVCKPEHIPFIKESPNILTVLLALPMQDDFDADAEICLEDILVHIVKTLYWEHALFEILELLDSTKPHCVFRIVVKCLEISCVECMIEYISPEPIEKVCTQIQKYISQQSKPQNMDIDADKLLVDAQPIVYELSRFLDVIVCFYNATSKALPSVEWRTVPCPEWLLVHHVFDLFRSPIVYLQTHKGSYAHSPCSELMVIVLSMFPNFERIFNSMSKKKSHKPTFHPKAVGSFLHCVYHLELGHEYLPQVYSAKYIYRRTLPAALALLSNGENIVQEKGLQLLKSLLYRIPDCDIDANLLELQEFKDLFSKLIDVMVFSEQKPLRVTALEIYKEHVPKLNLHCRFQVFLHFLTSTEHSGFKAVVLQSFKKEIVVLKTALESKDEEICRLILKSAWTLPDGETSDLLDLNDVIMTTLNILIFLCSLKDFREKLVVNHLNDIETEFLKPLRLGLNFSRAHYESAATQNGPSDSSQVGTLSVSGEYLPQMSPAEKSQRLKLAINIFDMMAISHAQLSNAIESLKASLKTV